MDCVMYVERQGTNLAPKVKELETRLEMLENAIKELKSDKPRMGRPPKEKNEQAAKQETTRRCGPFLFPITQDNLLNDFKF